MRYRNYIFAALLNLPLLSLPITASALTEPHIKTTSTVKKPESKAPIAFKEHYTVAINSMYSSGRPSVLFGVKHLTEDTSNKFIKTAQSIDGLSEIIEKRGNIGLLDKPLDKKHVFGTQSETMSDRLIAVAEDKENDTKFLFEKDRIKVKTRNHCSYYMVPSKINIGDYSGYDVVGKLPKCTHNIKSFPEAIYLTKVKE